MRVTYDEKNKLVTVTFAFDPAKNYPASKTGKTHIAATTSGFVSVPGTVCKVSLNATVPASE